jgi:phosphate starvation-inducible PhoH-like protein
MAEQKIKIKDDAEARKFFGKHDLLLRKLEETFNVKTVFRDGELKLWGDEKASVTSASEVARGLLDVLRKGGTLSRRDIDYAMKGLSGTHSFNDIFSDRIEVGTGRAPITPKTAGQKVYVDAIRGSDVVFCIGPAGTGKTYLAVAMAVNALESKAVSRIILTRPAVEAGESLGFLPGDMLEKVNPYLRPLYDALHDMVEPKTIKDYIDNDIIEVAPLAFMRGRTLNDSFIIMDEAQNSTPEQMKMFLTRIGYSSKAVVTGDVTQSDLPNGKVSGLMDARGILTDIRGLSFVELKGVDVIRHKVVHRIIEVYREHEIRKRKNEQAE